MTITEFCAILRADISRLSPLSDEGNIGQIRWLNLLNPRFTPVLLIRLARLCYLTSWLRPLSALFTWLNVLFFGIECTAKCDVGPGLFIPHSSGTVIGAGKIGVNSTIFQGVTLGAAKADMGFDVSLRPQLGDGVIVGAGAKILGGVSIGNNVTIGANAVVVHSFPSDVIVGGIPAKVIKQINV